MRRKRVLDIRGTPDCSHQKTYSRKGNREASFVLISPSISPGSSSTSTIGTTLTTSATLCRSTSHVEKTTHLRLKGPPDTTLFENIGEYRSTRQVKKSANAMHIQNFTTTERWTLEARATSLRNAEMQLISHSFSKKSTFSR